jgi:transcriptional regulator with GAF, ATPase, and Fis domain
MYDPLMVDTFIRVYQDIAPQAPNAELPKDVLNEITSATMAMNAPIKAPEARERRATANEALVLYELERVLEQPRDIRATAEGILSHLKRLVPFSQAALFTYDVSADELVVAHTSGEAATASLRGARVELGQRLSGWVAANRQTIANSDPALDLGDAATQGAVKLRSCLGAALVQGDQLVGVLTVYAEPEGAFSDDDRSNIEALARVAAPAVKAAAADGPSRRSADAVAIPAAS